MTTGNTRKTASKKEKVPPISFDANTAKAVQSEFDSYSKRIFITLLKSCATIAVAFILFQAFNIMSTWNETNHKVLLPRLSGSTILSGFGVLAVVVTTLSITVRAPLNPQQDYATLGRRRFLALLSFFLVSASIGLGLYGATNALDEAPNILNLAGLFGPLLGGIVLAVFAADASLVMDDDVDPSDTATEQRSTQIEKLEAELKIYQAGVSASAKPKILTNICLLMIPPLLLTIASIVHSPIDNFGVGLTRLGAFIVFSILTYAAVWAVYRQIVKKFWITLIVTIPLLTVIALIITLSTFVAVISSEKNSPRDAIWSIGLISSAWIFPAVVSVFSLHTIRNRPGILRWAAIRVTERQISNLTTKPQKAIEQKPRNWLAIISLLFIPFFPIGVIAATVVRQRNSELIKANPKAKVGGEREAHITIVSSFAFLGLYVLIAVVLWIANPEWPAEWY